MPRLEGNIHKKDNLFLAKITGLKADSRDFFAIMHKLSPSESEKRNKEIQQVPIYMFAEINNYFLEIPGSQ